MSWNGATKVTQWRIYAGNSTKGPWAVLNTFDKNGFETLFTAPKYHAWSLVEALDAHGKGLKNSSRPIRAFVPGAQLAASCDAFDCPS